MYDGHWQVSLPTHIPPLAQGLEHAAVKRELVQEIVFRNFIFRISLVTFRSRLIAQQPKYDSRSTSMKQEFFSV